MALQTSQKLPKIRRKPKLKSLKISSRKIQKLKLQKWKKLLGKKGADKTMQISQFLNYTNHLDARIKQQQHTEKLLMSQKVEHIGLHSDELMVENILAKVELIQKMK